MTATEPQEPPPGGRRKGDKPMISLSSVFQTVMGICATLLTAAILGMYGSVQEIKDVQNAMQTRLEMASQIQMSRSDWSRERTEMMAEIRAMGDQHVTIREYRDGLEAIRQELTALRRAVEERGGQ